MIIVCLHMYVEENYPRLKTYAVWYGRPRISESGVINNLQWTNIENYELENVTSAMLPWAKITLSRRVELGNIAIIVMIEETQTKY